MQPQNLMIKDLKLQKILLYSNEKLKKIILDLIVIIYIENRTEIKKAIIKNLAMKHKSKKFRIENVS